MDSKQFKQISMEDSVNVLSIFRGLKAYIEALEDARIDPQSCIRKHAALFTNNDDGEFMKKVAPFKSHPFMEKQLGSTIEEYCKDKITEITQATLAAIAKLDYVYVGKDIIDSLHQDIFTFNNKDFLTNKNRLLFNEDTKSYAVQTLQQEFQKDNLSPLLTGINLNILFTNLSRLVESLITDGTMFSDLFTKPIENYIYQNVHSFQTPIDAPVLEDNGFYKLIQNATTNLSEKDPLYSDDTNNVLMSLVTLVNNLVKTKEVLESRVVNLGNLISKNLFRKFQIDKEHDNTKVLLAELISLPTKDVINLEVYSTIEKELSQRLDEFGIYVNNILYPYFYYRYESKVIMFIYNLIFSLLKQMNVGLSRFNLTSKIV